MADLSPYIGTVDDIKIQLHWSFLLLLLVILLFSIYYFILWVFLFIGVLIHELTHSITSKRNGVRVKKIVLYPLGGGSILDFEDVKPEVEFRISIVGPIASLLLAAIFGILSIYAPAGIVRYTIQTLFWLNLSLGIFNILPWLPLDGGRALRSYLQRSMSYYDATRVTFNTSKVVAGLFVGGTIVYAALASGYSLAYREFIVLWDLAIVIFVYNGAQVELETAYIKDNISDLHVYNAISKHYVIVKPNTSVAALYKIMLKNHTHLVLFTQGDKVKIVSHAALHKASKNINIPNRSIEEFGVEIPQISYYAQLFNSVEKMRTEDTNISAVIKDKKIAGILLMQHVESIIAIYLSHKKTKTYPNK